MEKFKVGLVGSSQLSFPGDKKGAFARSSAKVAELAKKWDFDLYVYDKQVIVAADGYATRTQALSANRSYPNLSEADVSLIPKSIEEDGKTLTLADVQWSSTEQSDGAGGTVTRYTAAASYTVTSSYQYATGYTVTADYSGQVAKPNCNMATYTAIFGSTETGALDTEQDGGTENETGAVDLSGLKIPLLVGGAAVLLAAGGLLAFKKIKERR